MENDTNKILICKRCWNEWESDWDRDEVIFVHSCESCFIISDRSDKLIDMMLENMDGAPANLFPDLIRKLWRRIQECDRTPDDY